MCARLQALKEWDRAHQGLEMPRAVQIEHDGDHGQWNKHWNLDRAKLQADDAHHCNLVEHDGSDNPPEDHGKIGGAAFKGRQIDVHHLILENKVAQRTETQHQNRNERRDRGVREADQHHENEVGKRRNVGELLWSVNGPLLLRSDSEQRLENWIDDQRNELQQLHRQPGQHCSKQCGGKRARAVVPNSSQKDDGQTLKHDEVHKEAVAAWYRRAHQRNNACWRIDELIQLRKGAACDDCDEKRIDHLEVAHLSGRFPESKSQKNHGEDQQNIRGSETPSESWDHCTMDCATAPSTLLKKARKVGRSAMKIRRTRVGRNPWIKLMIGAGRSVMNRKKGKRFSSSDNCASDCANVIGIM
eukprot:m.191523 g.191523  ORF g.191523 m.191523 type:complete len:358 (+) comp53641_c0_seq12:568-1641(+)